MKMAKDGVDTKVFDYFDFEELRIGDVFEECQMSDILLFQEKTKQKYIKNIDLLEVALGFGLEEEIALNELLAHCDPDEVKKMLKKDIDWELLEVFYNETGRWDLCRDAIINHHRSDTKEFKKTFLNDLVTDKDANLDKEDLYPYIRVLLKSLISLPVYVIYKIISETFHTHKYFEEWEIISMIQMAKGEDTIYTNHPEYEDCFDFSELTLAEQKRIFNIIYTKYKWTSATHAYEEKLKYAMETYWILNMFPELKTLPEIKNKAKQIKNRLTRYYGVLNAFPVDNRHYSVDLEELEETYMDLCDQWIVGNIYKSISHIREETTIERKLVADWLVN